MDEKICCFIGHSEVREGVHSVLEEAVERHITQYGVTEFRVGNYGQFDRMAGRAVVAAKARHPGIRLFLMLPYLPEHGRPLPNMEGYDGSIYPEGMEKVPYGLAIPRLNKIMVQDADYVIAYVRYTWGGAATTLAYAKVRERKGCIRIENLAWQHGEGMIDH